MPGSLGDEFGTFLTCIKPAGRTPNHLRGLVGLARDSCTAFGGLGAQGPSGSRGSIARFSSLPDGTTTVALARRRARRCSPLLAMRHSALADLRKLCGWCTSEHFCSIYLCKKPRENRFFCYGFAGVRTPCRLWPGACARLRTISKHSHPFPGTRPCRNFASRHLN